MLSNVADLNMITDQKFVSYDAMILQPFWNMMQGGLLIVVGIVFGNCIITHTYAFFSLASFGILLGECHVLMPQILLLGVFFFFPSFILQGWVYCTFIELGWKSN